MEKKEKKRNGKQRVTLKDIAEASGLALSTVSNALAGRSLVREDTRKHLLKVANDLGYRSSSLARSLRTGKTNSIGFLIPDITSPFYAEVIRGAEDVLFDKGYFLLIGNSDRSGRRELEYLSHFIDRQVEGVILVPYAMNSEGVQQIKDAGIPLCLLNRKHTSPGNDLIGADFQAATHATLNYLWDLGHRKIGFILGSADSSVAMERIAASRLFLYEKGAPVESIIFLNALYTLDAGREAAARLMDGAPGITAIMTGQDQVALGVITALMERGLRVPQDVSVIGFDDVLFSSLPQISLTSLHVPRRTLGRMAAELMLERIADPDAIARTVQITPELVVRGSSGPAPS